MTDLPSLINLLAAAPGPCRWLDAKIDAALRIGAKKMRDGGYAWAWDNFPTWAAHEQAHGMCGVQQDDGIFGLIWDSAEFTASTDAAIMLARVALPGWSYRVASCCVSDDAWVQPDFDCPTHGARLLSELSPAVDWVDLTDVDLRPSGREAIALCIAVLRGVLSSQQREYRHVGA